MVKAAGDTGFVPNTKEIQAQQNFTMHLRLSKKAILGKGFSRRPLPF
jgi:hypothetical protein